MATDSGKTGQDARNALSAPEGTEGSGLCGREVRDNAGWKDGGIVDGHEHSD